MEESKLKITCVIPVYNGGKYIRNAIESIQKQEEPWELVLVDGGSTDKTEEIVRSYNDPRIRFVSIGHSGDPYMREDHGIEIASGDYYHNMGCDDIVLKDAYKVVRENLAGEDWIYGNMVLMDENYNKIRENHSPVFNYHQYMQGNMLATPPCFLRLDFIRKHGLKHTNRWPNSDYYFLRQVARKTKPKQIGNMLIGVMMRPDSISGGMNKMKEFSDHKREMMEELNKLPLPDYAKDEVINPKVLVAIGHHGTVRTEMLQVIATIITDGRCRLKIIYPSERMTEDRFAKLGKKVVKEGWDFLLSIDADNPPTKNPLDLVFLDKDIMGLPTPQWYSEDKYPIFWTALKKVPNGWDQWEDRQGLQQVDAVGSGCIIIKRKVFEAIPDAPFERKWNKDGTQESGADFNFCEKARSRGFEIWTHFDYPCSHFKELDLLEVLKFKHRE